VEAARVLGGRDIFSAQFAIAAVSIAAGSELGTNGRDSQPWAWTIATNADPKVVEDILLFLAYPLATTSC